MSSIKQQSNILNPQSIVKQVKGRTVKDVRLQNTQISSVVKTADRPKSIIKKSLGKTSRNKPVRQSKSKNKTDKSI